MAAKRLLPHCSQSAFVGLVKLAKATDISQLPTTREQYRQAKVKSLPDTPYGPMLTTVTLQAVPPYANREMTVVNPLAYLYTAFNTGGGYFDFMKSKLASDPSTPTKPWRLCLYSDEVVPGNQLAPNNARKVWVLYFGFLECHPHLSNENVWCPIVAEPSTALTRVSAGISQVFAQVIKLFFCGPFDLRVGIQLTGPEGSNCVLRLCAVLSMFLQDGGAHKHVWGCKGDGGTRLCMLCKNLIAEMSGAVDADGTNILVCSLIHEHQLQFASDAEIRRTIDRLAGFKSTDSNQDFKLRQQAFGFTFQEHGLLNDAELKDIVHPASKYCHDWMHCLFASGVFNIVVFLCFSTIRLVRTNVWEVLHDFVAAYTWPHSANFKPSVRDHLSTARVKAHTKAKQFKCPASDGLSLLGVMCYFIQAVALRIPGVDKCACDALIALSDLVDALVAVPLGVVTPDYLRERIRSFLAACETAGWKPHFIPKFHWLIHLYHALLRWLVLPTCWVHERKHRMVKRYGEDIYNTGTYSSSVLSETISHQLVAVEQADAFDRSLGLVKPCPAPTALRDFVLENTDQPDTSQVLTSVSARVSSGFAISKTDVVLLPANDNQNFVAGRVWHLVSVGMLPVALVSLWELVSQDKAAGTSRWHMAERAAFVRIDTILSSVIWTESSAGVALVLVPLQYRGVDAVADSPSVVDML